MRLVLRPTPLVLSVLLHAVVYSTLTVVPTPTARARAGLVADLLASEPVQPEPSRAVPPPHPTAAPAPRVIRTATAKPKRATPPPPAHATSAAVSAPPPAMASVAADVVAIVPADAPAAVVADAAPARAGAAPPDAAAASDPGAAAAPSTTTTPAASASVASLGPVATQPAIPRGGYQVRPSYPTSARRLGIEGTTLLGVLVEADGRVGDVVVKQSAGHPDLDRAAADAVRRWRFEPARKGMAAVAMWVDLPVEFHLR